MDSNVWNYNLLVPNKELYESEDFFEEYKINEVKLVIQWIEPLDNDKIVIRTKNSDKQFHWHEIKDFNLHSVI